MISNRLSFIILLLWATGLQAQSVAPLSYEQCQRQAFSSADFRHCMQQELKRVDGLLNRYYRQAMKTLQPFRRPELRRVQRLWIAYRDARCGFFNHAESGSGGVLDELQCLIDETARRARELSELY